MTEEKQTRYNEIAQKHGDPWIWGIYLTLIVISVIESYSAASREVAQHGVYMPILKQCAFLFIGALIVIFLRRIDYNRNAFLIFMIPVLAFTTVLLLIYTMFFGDLINGARRSFHIAFITVQPSEIAKLSIVTLLSYLLAKNQKNRDVSNKGIFWSVLAVSVYGILMYKSGFTNTAILFAVSGSMLIIGGAKWKKIGIVMLFYLLAGGLYLGLKSHNDNTDRAVGGTELVKDQEDRTQVRMGRWGDFLKNKDSLVYMPINDRNQQEMFSRMAQAHGGVHGVGPGRSRECSRLPLAFSDYIYSIIVEETGLIGGLFVLALYLWLLARAAMIVRRSRRVLPSLLIIGMAAMVTCQALCHIAINVGVVPVSGQPLPLVSMGGSSIIVMSVAFGVMISVSRTIANYNNKNNKPEEAALPEGLDAENPTQIPPTHVWK
ncbi:MAG: FtsW/RodA/SpoVE family cell cycle protein [Muribaculaceae bacterium]|nr:FtsW/RodA/SpoVE family cell cycle protein [Muribaculaceae bacterium]